MPSRQGKRPFILPIFNLNKKHTFKSFNFRTCSSKNFVGTDEHRSAHLEAEHGIHQILHGAQQSPFVTEL